MDGVLFIPPIGPDHRRDQICADCGRSFPARPAIEPRSSAKTATGRSLSPGACDTGRNRPDGCTRCASAVPTNGRYLTAYIGVGV